MSKLTTASGNTGKVKIFSLKHPVFSKSRFSPKSMILYYILLHLLIMVALIPKLSSSAAPHSGFANKYPSRRFRFYCFQIPLNPDILKFVGLYCRTLYLSYCMSRAFNLIQLKPSVSPNFQRD